MKQVHSKSNCRSASTLCFQIEVDNLARLHWCVASSTPVAGSCSSELQPLRAEVLVQLGTLIQQQLVVRVSSESVLEGMRLRCEAPKEVVQGVAAIVNFDLRQYEEE